MSELGSNGEFSTGQTLSALLSQADFSRLGGLVTGHKRTHALHKFFVSLDHLVGAAEQRCRDLDAELFCRLRFIAGSNLVGCKTCSSEGFSHFKIRPT
jgi:hypothetical protein